jgi:hypothetical protein
MALEDPENRRLCQEPWGHWIKPGSRHAGPVVGKWKGYRHGL